MANSFPFSCPNCNHQMKLPASAEGKKGKCPKCSEVVNIIPDAPEPPAVTQQIPSPQQQSISEPVLPEQAAVPSSPPEIGSPKTSSGKKKLFIGIGIVVLAVVAVGLFFVLRGSNEVVEDVEAKKQKIDVSQAIVKSWKTNELEWPDNLEQVKPLMEEADTDWLLNPITGDDPGYEYVKPTGDLTNVHDATTVLLYQLRDGERDLDLQVCFRDHYVSLLDFFYHPEAR